MHFNLRLFIFYNYTSIWIFIQQPIGIRLLPLEFLWVHLYNGLIANWAVVVDTALKKS